MFPEQPARSAPRSVQLELTSYPEREPSHSSASDAPGQAEPTSVWRMQI